MNKIGIIFAMYEELEEQIEDKKETDCLLTKIAHLHRGCDVYEIASHYPNFTK